MQSWEGALKERQLSHMQMTVVCQKNMKSRKDRKELMMEDWEGHGGGAGFILGVTGGH